MGYIPPYALDNLKKYAYKGVDKSLLSRHVLNPYWNWLVTFWPTWVAPNVITMSGLCMVLLNFATLLYYDPGYLTEREGAEGPPQWIYFTWAAGLFIYQSFDAIDGKQARRTGMAGPLGEMFDHGCDALNTTLEVILCSRALNLGRSWWTVASQIATLANFYLTTWEEYHTGQLYLGVFSGPVEGILLIVGIFIVTGIYGPTFWDTPALEFLGLQDVPILAKFAQGRGLNEAFMAFGAVMLAFNIATSYFNVFKARMSNHQNPFRPLLHLLPFPASAAIQIFWLSSPSWTQSAIINSPLFVPFLCAWGLQFSHQVGRMILAHVTKQPFPWGDAMWVWSLLGAVDANLPLLLNRPPLIQHNMHNIGVVVFITLGVSFVSYARWCTLVIGEITNFLGIACFTVRKKDLTGHWRRAASVDKIMVGKKL
ncbi:choline/ethanolaminephosphotransferase [Phanerochaete sordida]|uniref:diacylglycerol cholinephosphotransferase n=1 Tax=Phanerochaete sordida TaxID=48140 RepID=A0A9P3GPS5_9APHY|nr:choline/ethanolaminephosphotransferase [Phanerochaete sordida]